MIHLRRYDESSGQPWRQVGRDEMRRLMDGKEADTFTKADVQEVVAFLNSTGRKGMLTEYDTPFKTRLRNRKKLIDLFIQPARELRGHSFGLRAEPEVIHPRVPADSVYINFFNEYINPLHIFKSTDDYYYGLMENRRLGTDYFVCDGISGLLSMLDQRLS
jgi:hypothetical protein